MRPLPEGKAPRVEVGREGEMEVSKDKALHSLSEGKAPGDGLREGEMEVSKEEFLIPCAHFQKVR